MTEAQEYIFRRSVVHPETGCWLWGGPFDQAGYGIGSFKRLGTKQTRVHRVAWLLFEGPIPPGLKVLHRCDVRNCLNPRHLFIGTQQDNVTDCIKKGRAKFPVPKLGEKNPQAKLTKDGVFALRAYRKKHGVSYAKIGRRFGISTMTAFRAISGESWKHLNKESLNEPK